MAIKLCFFGDAQSEHTQRWVEAMAHRGFETYLITNRPASLSHTLVIPISGRKTGLGWFGRVATIRRKIEEIKPDIVHGHYITSYGFWAAASGVHPMVLTAWGSDILVTPKKNMLMRWLTRWSLKQADLVTADAWHVLDEIRELGPTARLEQVQWGVDINSYVPLAGREEGTIHLISLRLWEESYNIPVIIRAFSDLRRRLPDAPMHLHLLGGGSLESSLKDLAASLGLEQHMSFHGRLAEHELLRLLQRSDISISVPDSDGTAVSVLESMAVGLPLAVSDLPANHQWISREGGMIVPAGDVEALSRALELLVRDGELRRKMGQRNRKLILQHADREKEMDRMAELYHRLMTGERRA